MNVNEDSFQLNLLFEGEKSPVDAFNQMKEIFKTLSSLDNTFLSSIDNGIEASYAIQSIEFSSIKTRIAQIIREIPDEAIKELEWKKIIGHFLVNIKYLVLKYLDDNQAIEGKDELEQLSKRLESEKLKTLNKHGYIITEVNSYKLVNVLEQVVVTAAKLKDGERIEYKSAAGNAQITNKITFNKAKVLWELGDTASVNETIEVLKIKRIDLLSNNGNWSFMLGGKPIDVRITDQDWLDKYHARDYPLLPEDSLKVKLKVSYVNNKDGKIVKPTYEVVKVIDIIYPENNQSELF
jgi:hypothetical protein